MTTTSYPAQIILVRPAAALVANTPYTLSNTAVGDVPTATVTGVGGRVDIVTGFAPITTSSPTTNVTPGEFYNATVGKDPNAPFAVGDVFAVSLQGFPIATMRAGAALTEGVPVATNATGQVIASTGNENQILGITIGAQSTVNGLIDVLFNPRVNPVYATTLALLGTPATAGAGARRVITDSSTAYTVTSPGTTAVGGGANVAPVFSTGAAWLYG